MALFNFTRFEPPSIRQARLFETTRRLTGEVLSFTEQLEENLLRFRQVEQRQNLQFAQPRPTLQQPTPEQTAVRQGRVFPDPALRGTDVGDRQQRIFDRATTLFEETRANFPSGRTPPGTTIESLVLEKLELEFGDELRAAQGGGGLLGTATSLGLGALRGIGQGIGAADEAAFQANRFINQQLDTPPEQRLSREEVGVEPLLETLESGTALSRPVVDVATDVAAAPLRGVESARIPVVSPAAGRTADVIQSQIVEDIATEVINPVAILAVAPFAMVGTTVRGVQLTGRALVAQITANLLGTGLEPGLVRGVLRGFTALRLAARGGQLPLKVTDVGTARSAAAVLRKAGNTEAAEQLENLALAFEGTEAIRGGRGLVSEPTGRVIGAGAPGLTPADVGGALRPVTRATGLGDVTGPEFAPGVVRGDVPVTGETISSQVLEPRPVTGPAILETQFPGGVRQALVGEAGGGRPLAGIADAKDFFGRLIDPLLPQGGIEGGFRARPKGMRPGARVTGLSQDGEQIEGALVQISGEKAIIRDAAGNIRPITEPALVEAATRPSIGERLKDIGRDFRFGPSSRTAIPALDPSVQRFVRVLRTAKPTQRTLKAERAEELGRRAARGRVPFEAEARTPEEALRGLRGAQRGKLPEAPEFEVTLPSGERGLPTDAFTQEEVTNFINIARFSPALDRELFTRGNIIESLIGSLDKKGILFGRLPTPGELKQLERVYGAEFARELGKLRPFGERFWRLTLDALNIPRSLLAAFDLSFPFRQGVFAFARHPKEFFGNLPAMLRAAKNPEFAEQMVAAIKADRTLIQTSEGFRPLNELMEEAKLFLPDVSGTEAFEARAEEFLSNLARRIPGVGFSERGFIAYGDKLRSDIFRNTLQSWARQGKPATADEIADLGIMLNVLTGRGNLPPELAKSLSFGFFAPRFAASRPQLFLAATVNNIPGARKVTGTLLGVPGQTTRVARLATQELVTSVGSGLAILALVKLSGVGDVELNPTSSDFGKIRIGKTRIDFWGGARPWATMIARMITGKSKSVTGEFSISRLSTLGRFGRSKLAPPAALLVDVIAGETAIGEEIGTTGDILRRTLPLAIQDVADAVIQEGATRGLLSTAAFLGVGFQTYETPGEKKKKAFEEAFPDRTYEATPDDNRLVRGAIEEGNNKDALEDAFQPSPEQVETEEARVAQATELGLFTLALGVDELRGLSAEEILTSRSDAGPEFADAWVNYLDRISGAIFEAVFGKDKRGSPEYLAWRDIKLQRDPDTFELLWEEFFEAKDAAFEKLDPRLQRALDLVDAPGDDPTLQEAVEDFSAARKTRRELFNLPRWVDVDAAEQKQIEDIHDLVERKRTELAFQGISDVEASRIYAVVGRENGIESDLLRKAFSLRSGTAFASAQRDPRFDELLLASPETLLPFFPDMFRRREIQAALGAGPSGQDSRIPVPTSGTAPRIPVTTTTSTERIPVP